jgi:hypothetical protein
VDGTKRTNEPPAGVMRNISLQNVIAHGTGTSGINGHPDSWLENVRLQNIRLSVSRDPQAPYENTSSAMTLRQARNFALKDVEIGWEPPVSATWRNGLVVDQVKNLELENVSIAPAPSSPAPLLTLNDADQVTVRNSDIETLHLAGKNTGSVRLIETKAKVTLDPSVKKGAVIHP